MSERQIAEARTVAAGLEDGGEMAYLVSTNGLLRLALAGGTIFVLGATTPMMIEVAKAIAQAIGAVVR